MTSSKRRVVITGMGAIGPLGNTTETLWEALVAGRSGVRPMSSIPSDAFPTHCAAEAHAFQGKIDDFGPLEKEQKKAIRKGLKVMCRECLMGVAVAQRALADAGLKPGAFDPERVGVNFGADYMLSIPEEFTDAIRVTMDSDGEFDYARWPTDGLARMSPLWLLKYLPNMPASHLAIYNDLRGPSNSLTLREASPNLSAGEAATIIADGRADIMLIGATGTRVHAMKTIHAVQQEELASDADDPATMSRPFDRDRTGMVLGEGAGAMVLEELDSAQARGATIHGEIVATASSCVAERRLVARRDLALKNVLVEVLARAEAAPEDIGHVHAHGLGARSSDAEEAWAIHQVFGERSKPVPVAAAKSFFGNLGAGSGMVEAVASVMALNRGTLFPVLNYETPDPECPVAVAADGEAEPGASFINLNVTPQGQASAMLVQAFGS